MRQALLLMTLLAATCQAEENEKLKRTGGFVMPPDNGSRIVVVNTCNANTNAIRQFVSLSEGMLHIPLKVVDEAAKTGCVYRAARSYKGKAAPAVIYVYAGEKDGPILTVHMEDAIATVNVTPLKSITDRIEADRLMKELCRAYGTILGAYYSAKMPSVLEPAYGVGQIDNIRVKMFSPMHMSTIIRGARLLEIPVLRPISYAAACRAGWAAAPTNEYQKAIWNSVHDEKERGPANALKITPPKK